MIKPISYLPFAFFLLFSGCNSTDTDSSVSPSSTPIQIETKPQTQSTTLREKGLLIQISATNIQAGESVDFSISDPTIQSVQWKDETGKVLSTDFSFNRLFTEPGTYETIAVITDQDGQVKTERVVVEVSPASNQNTSDTNQPPVAKAKAESLDIMDGEYIHLSDDGSYDPDGTIVKYEWRDMDGILLSTGKTLDRILYYDPQYDFNHDGTTRYVKTLYVTDDKGAVSFISFTIIVHQRTSTPTPPITTPANTPTTTPNHAPTARSKTLVVYSGESMMIVLGGSDADSDALSYRIIQQPQHGTLSNNLPNVIYTSNYGYVGEDSFTYVVNDGKVDSAPVTVHLTVRAKPVTNLSPTANPQSVTLDEDTSVNITLTGSSPDGSDLTYNITTQPTHGTLSGTAPNLTYTPEANYNGSDSFSFTVNDGTTDSAPATVSITINDVNDTPTVDAGEDTNITQGDRYVPVPTANDIDGTIVSTIWTEEGTVLTFPKDDFSIGTHILTVTVTDDDGATASDSLTLTVKAQPVNCPLMVKTGQTTVYADFDDGDLQRGLERNYTRDDTKEVVSDNATRLMWQDDSEAQTVKKNWQEAVDYCEDLTLGGFTDWKLPTIKQLVSITDKSRGNPSIDLIFQNTFSHYYWSSTTSSDTSSWRVSFYTGSASRSAKTNTYNVRCVRNMDN